MTALIVSLFQGVWVFVVLDPSHGEAFFLDGQGGPAASCAL